MVMDWVAVYAAVVGTTGLAWGIYRDRRSDRFDIAVDVKLEVALLEPGTDQPRFTVVVTATNNGGTDEMVEYIGLDYFDPTSTEGDNRSGDSRHVSAELRPRRNVTEGFDLRARRHRAGREYRGFVRLASGTVRTSSWHEFDLATLNTVGMADAVLNPRAAREYSLPLPDDERRPRRNEDVWVNWIH